MRTFGHTRPVRNEQGEIIGSEASPVRARTIDPLGPAFGPDREHRLVVTLEAADTISIRPEKTGRSESILAKDLYAYLLRCKANLSTLERARERKAAKATRLAQQRQQRAERRLTKGVHHDEI